MLKIIMAPANAVCDAFQLKDQHERGMMRMLVNMLLVTALIVVVFSLAWRFVAP
jgi:hypothetical protein